MEGERERSRGDGGGYLGALSLEGTEGAEAVLAGAVVEALVHLGEVLGPALLTLEGVSASLP
jgi:hypothetical protein